MYAAHVAVSLLFYWPNSAQALPRGKYETVANTARLKSFLLRFNVNGSTWDEVVVLCVSLCGAYFWVMFLLWHLWYLHRNKRLFSCKTISAGKLIHLLFYVSGTCLFLSQQRRKYSAFIEFGYVAGAAMKEKKPTYRNWNSIKGKPHNHILEEAGLISFTDDVNRKWIHFSFFSLARLRTFWVVGGINTQAAHPKTEMHDVPAVSLHKSAQVSQGQLCMF